MPTTRRLLRPARRRRRVAIPGAATPRLAGPRHHDWVLLLGCASRLVRSGARPLLRHHYAGDRGLSRLDGALSSYRISGVLPRQLCGRPRDWAARRGYRGLDQTYNAIQVVRQGAGRSIAARQYTVRQATDALHALITEPAYRHHSQHLHDRFVSTIGLAVAGGTIYRRYFVAGRTALRWGAVGLGCMLLTEGARAGSSAISLTSPSRPSAPTGSGFIAR